MAIVKQFLRDTRTNAGTGGIGYDLSEVQGTSATLVSGTQNNDTYDQKFFWQFNIPETATVNTSSFSTSIEITALTASPTYRWRLQRVNSSNVVQDSSAYSTVHNTTGTKTETFTFSTTWNLGDRLRLSLEVNRESGHSASGVTVGVNRTTSFVDVDITNRYEVTLNSPANNSTGISTTPTLTFTGTSFNVSDLGYNIFIHLPDFLNASILPTNSGRYSFIGSGRFVSIACDTALVNISLQLVGRQFNFTTYETSIFRSIKTFETYAENRRVGICEFGEDKCIAGSYFNGALRLACFEATSNDILNISGFYEFTVDIVSAGILSIDWLKDNYFCVYTNEFVYFFEVLDTTFEISLLFSRGAALSRYCIRLRGSFLEEDFVLAFNDQSGYSIVRYQGPSYTETTLVSGTSLPDFPSGNANNRYQGFRIFDNTFIHVDGGRTFIAAFRLVSDNSIERVRKVDNPDQFWEYARALGPSASYIGSGFRLVDDESSFRGMIHVSGFNQYAELYNNFEPIYNSYSNVDTGFEQQTPFQSGVSTTFVPPIPLEAPLKYNWKVRGFDPFTFPTLLTGPWSDDWQFTTADILAFEESVILSASSAIAAEVALIISGLVSVSSVNSLEAFVNLIVDGNSSISADSDTLPLNVVLMELSASLTTDSQVNLLSAFVFDSIASISASSNVAVELNAILQGFVDLISNGTVTAQASVLFEETITLLKDAQVDYDALQVLETIVTITSDHDLLVQAGLVTDASVDLDTIVFTEAEMVKIIEAAVSLLSQADITGQVNAIMEEVSTIIADSSITVDGNLLYELVISLLGDSDITVLASKVLDETLILSSQHLDSYQVQAIVDEAVDIISNSLIEFQVYLLVEEVISVLADSGLDVDSEAVYENAVTLLTDADFQAFLDSFIDVSVEISSAHFTDAQSEAIMDALVDLTMEGVIEAQINKIIEGVVSLLSDSGITVDVNIVVNVVSLILSSSNITSQGNIETEEDVSMQSDHDIFIDEDLVIDLAVSLISESLIDFQIEAILSNAITILADSGIEADTEMVMEALAEILSGSEIVASTGNIFTGEVDLNSSHFTEAESEAILVALVDLIQNSQIDSASIAEMENASQIGSDAQIDKTGNILMDGSVSLDFNTQIQNIGSLLIEKNIMLFTESFITSLGNVLVDESVLFDTDASTDEGYNTIFSKVVELIMNSIVQASADSESSLDITLSLNTEYTVTAQHLIAEISYLIANADLSVLGMVESADSDEIALLISTGILSEAFGEFLNESLISGEITDSYDAVVEYFAFIGLDVSAEAVYELFVEINAIFEAIAQASITFVEEYIPGQVPSEYEEAVTVSAIAQLFVNLTTVDGQALKIIGISMFRFINKLK